MTYEELAKRFYRAERQAFHLRSALKEVMTWLRSEKPGFLDDPSWREYTEPHIREVLEETDE